MRTIKFINSQSLIRIAKDIHKIKKGVCIRTDIFFYKINLNRERYIFDSQQTSTATLIEKLRKIHHTHTSNNTQEFRFNFFKATRFLKWNTFPNFQQGDNVLKHCIHTFIFEERQLSF